MPINMFQKGGSSRRLRVSKLSEQRTAHHFASQTYVGCCSTTISYLLNYQVFCNDFFVC